MEERRRRVYGRRLSHRLRPGRQALLERALPALQLALPEDTQARIDLSLLFPAPVGDLWLEIGFGAGEHLACQVRANPAVGFIGCEPFVQGVAGLLRHLEADGTTGRVRIFPDDARLLLDRLPEACVGRLFVLFSDPWPKKRHHKRRLIDGETLAAFARILKDGAEFRWASDDAGYVEWTLEHVAGNQAFALIDRISGDWPSRAARLAGDPLRAEGSRPRSHACFPSLRPRPAITGGFAWFQGVGMGALGRNTLKRMHKAR